ncbi:PAQR family membrane homeostasis protein TrhA [Rubellimicrobium aerolatum]|uniref:Hemolysin III family protein n=1 Tax=Rubellimicrobium aerolatum TaxID=490979 RepID=A0ABW0SEF3_9RHOB|nr:hemolysin III family protein [Rubellimicrobium aerolatum]MBP1805677.1 hemolysin III [Rubellimicrobium aerolatum]
MTPPRPTYPAYARSERIADGVIHALGVAFAVAGAGALTVLAARHAGGARAVAAAVYGAALVATFLASAFYHMTPWERLRPALRRIDHAAIFLKIAGTFTPLAVLAGGPMAWGVLALVWTLAAFGALAKVLWWHEPGWAGLALYLGLGWLGLPLVWPLAGVLPGTALALAVAGGLLYTLGVVFFAWERLKFSNAIWHAFVLLASGCFFAAITLGTFA